MAQKKPIIYTFNDAILFIGNIPTNTWHSIPVDTISINLNEPFNVLSPNGSNEKLSSLYWPAGVKRKTEYKQDDILMFLMFPRYMNLSSIFPQHFKSHWSFNTAVKCNLSNEDEFKEILLRLYQERPDVNLAKQWLNNISINQNKIDLFGNKTEWLDSRVERKIHHIKSNILLGESEQTSGITEISPQHLGRLFNKQIGCSVVQYKKHLRMVAAALIKAYGYNVSESIQGVGFFDLSHAEKAHQSSYGISTANTLKASTIKADTHCQPWKELFESSSFNSVKKLLDH